MFFTVKLKYSSLKNHYNITPSLRVTELIDCPGQRGYMVSWERLTKHGDLKPFQYGLYKLIRIMEEWPLFRPYTGQSVQLLTHILNLRLAGIARFSLDFIACS